jgi:flagellum-specific ATP synthase
MIADIPFVEFQKKLETVKYYNRTGKVVEVVGLIIQVEGIEGFVGEICKIEIDPHTFILSEVVGFRENLAQLMPLDNVHGIKAGCSVYATGQYLKVKVGDELLGKTLDGLGRVIDGEKVEPEKEYSIYRDPPNPFKRRKIADIIPTGIKAIDGLLTCGEGQRLGIFAGSGVGKSTLMGMISRYSEADVNVIALIGERGREVLEFIEDDLGEQGYQRTVVICATSDQPPLVRLKGAYVATAVAEYFRDQGKKVMFMMDSVTRFAMAKREVGLAIGEPPTSRGYTPSVFAELPQLMERSGMSDTGSITAFYTVLVEGDDMNEPIADAVRGILDGHIILSRKLAAKNHFPAISVGDSVSRLMKEIVSPDIYNYAGEMRENLSVYEEAEDLINVGAYSQGSNPVIDKSIQLHKPIEQFLRQGVDETSEFDDTLAQMRGIMLSVN